ncbi:CpsD/CapB family tyrosine-protein kinase [Phototrophicus methaneseepsis]|uniref:CpsD/CapB family tyrosine-protein kinase n=1 Tax=Phototrophicus methaneseepsis TaxID=2710758 RepID=A0A7S8EDP8_9CHLR|nr:CpsD/CapB family tyrosine-protein kinase [Phototrophicus methaneseepsis]QPC85046.1 CpsD/CapB family tyrosine-protein kinase [Phototrophicus methaneseepsis]
MVSTQLITLTDPRSNAAEAFRTLRTNLMFSSVEKPIQTLLVTSTSKADDKSVALANLAVTFAQAGNKTILVDSDMRQPMQHEIWGINNERGLADMMLDDTLLSRPPLQATDVDNLMLIPSGQRPPNPADILSSHRMDEIIGVLKARAAYILFDAPPVLAASDAVVLSTKVDGILLVVRANETRRDNVSSARSALEQVHARVVGAVLTNAPREQKRY